VHFTDPQFKSAIEAELGIKDPTRRDLYDLYYLDASDKKIESIQGIEYATNLKQLILNKNQIQYLSPLADMNHLIYLSVVGNRIKNITPLSTLDSIKILYLNDNQITDITPLRHLTSLRELKLNSNKIVDISVLANLNDLRFLELKWNKIKNVNPLSELTNLYDLRLGSNHIKDISPLAKLNKLSSLFLADNQIEDIEPISHFKNMHRINLKRNPLNRNSHTKYIRKLKSNNYEDLISYTSSIFLDTYYLVAIVVCVPIGLFIIYKLRKNIFIVYSLYKYLWNNHPIKTTIGTAILGFGFMGLYILFEETNSEYLNYPEILCLFGYILHLTFFVLLFILLLKNKPLYKYELVKLMVLGALITYMIPFFAMLILSFVGFDDSGIYDNLISISEQTSELYFQPCDESFLLFIWFTPGLILGAIVSLFVSRTKMNN